MEEVLSSESAHEVLMAGCCGHLVIPRMEEGEDESRKGSCWDLQ